MIIYMNVKWWGFAFIWRIYDDGGGNMRDKVKLACTECKNRNYDTMKNKKVTTERLEFNKYCKFCQKHTLHKETR